MSTEVTGLIAAVVSSVCFGSNYLVVKQHDMADGLFFQLMLCVGIWCVGFVYSITRSLVLGRGPFFIAEGTLGGIIWAFGNIATVPIFKMVGFGIGGNVWNATSMIVGWATGKWGLLGTPKTKVKNSVLNYTGVALALIAIALYSQVKPKMDDDQVIVDDEDPNALLASEKRDNGDEYGRSLAQGTSSHSPSEEYSALQAPVTESRSTTGHPSSLMNVRPMLDPNDSFDQPEGGSLRFDNELIMKQRRNVHSDKVVYPYGHYFDFMDEWSSLTKRVFGITLSAYAGVCYGLVFCPIQATIQSHKHNRDDYPGHLEDYAFSHFSGSLMTAVVFYAIYIAVTQNRPYVNTEAGFPSILSGVIWAIAQIAYFVGNDMLSAQLIFPLNCCGAQIVVGLWTILYLKEVEGRNTWILIAAISVSCASIVCVALS